MASSPVSRRGAVQHIGNPALRDDDRTKAPLLDKGGSGPGKEAAGTDDPNVTCLIELGRQPLFELRRVCVDRAVDRPDLQVPGGTYVQDLWGLAA